MKEAPTYVLITAGGQGTRMGSALPKQFLDLCGKPVLYHTVRAFALSLPQAHLVLVLPPEQISYAQMVLQHFPERMDISLVAGGPTRFYSVQNGLKGIPMDSIILVHDGVRPLASASLIRRCYEGAIAYGSAIPSLPVSDSIRQIQGQGSIVIDRTSLRAVQTPQAFRGDILLSAFMQEYRDTFTDEASVVESAGHHVSLVDGERSNIKITTPEDMIIATALMQEIAQ